uniref:BED-type domain-containing protein n=1 Tax=Ceratitis capitata TaxID=7213 RepID=W8C5I0_CERCA
MEPTIKYENCDDMYIIPTGSVQAGPGQKRHFDEMCDNSEYGNTSDGGFCQNNQNQPFQQQNTGFLAPTNQTLYAQSLNTTTGQQEIKGAKRYRRGESAVLFSPPFFEVPEDCNTQTDTFTARCVSCQVMLRGHKNVSSNFLKHMKRSHPEVHKMYEHYKVLKHHGLKSVTSTTDMSSLANKSSTDAAEQSLFDANIYLKSTSGNTTHTATETVENEENSEATENSQTNSNTDLNDTTENSIETPNNKKGSISACSTEINLSTKTLQAISKIFDEKLQSFATKSELSEVTTNILNQVRSRHGTPCSTVETESISDDENENNDRVDNIEQDKYETLNKELELMRQRLSHSESSKQILQRELHVLEKIVRKRKLIINNLPIAANQQPKAVVEQLFKERFGMPNVQLEGVTVIGNRNRQNNDRQTLLVDVVHEFDVNQIFRKSSCLKNTGIYIESQMSQISLKRKEKLLVLRREMLRRNASLKIFVRNTQLLVCDTCFYWDELLGLCMGSLDSPNNSLVTGDEAADELKRLTKLDMKEFLNVLKNYDIK